MTTEEKEKGLRRRIGSDLIIGCFTVRLDGSKCFSDIRGMEGDMVKDPGNEEIDYNDEMLEEGVFYSFKWKLNESGKIVVLDDCPKRIESKDIINNIFQARLNLSGSNLELFINFQNTIFGEVTGAEHTYIYELLQNANDYPYDGGHVHVKFIVTQHYLFFFHSGACFNLRNVVGISSINQGEKKRNTETIGYKGIGFKTVFVNNEYVYLQSGEWSLRFDKEYSDQKFYGDSPWSLMPIYTEPEELDEEAQEIIGGDDMRVKFALRHKSDARQNINQLDKVFDDDQILLFIPNVFRVDVIVDGKTHKTVTKDKNKWLVSHYSYKVPEDLKRWAADNIISGNKIPEKFKDIETVRISFAVGRDGRTLKAVGNARVYNYLPTELNLGFNFLINADFVPNGSRNGLHDVAWNDRIMTQCGVKFAEWWASLLRNEGEYDLNSAFELLPDNSNRDR